MTATADILRDARAIVAAGWCQFKAGRDGDRRCVYTAIADSCMRTGAARLPAIETFRRAIGADSSDFFAEVKWNDVLGRTHAEVLAAFDAAIALAERDGAGG